MNNSTLIEVKNVKYISNTLQLREFADYARATNRGLILYVRPTTKISKSLTNTEWKIKCLW